MQILLDHLADYQARIASGGNTDSCRLFHGRGQCYPGLEFVTLDAFAPVLLLTLFAEPPERWLEDFAKLQVKDEVRPLILKENAAKLLKLK